MEKADHQFTVRSRARKDLQAAKEGSQKATQETQDASVAHTKALEIVEQAKLALRNTKDDLVEVERKNAEEADADAQAEQTAKDLVDRSNTAVSNDKTKLKSDEDSLAVVKQKKSKVAELEVGMNQVQQSAISAQKKLEASEKALQSESSLIHTTTAQVNANDKSVRT